MPGFLINKGLVVTHIVAKYSVGYLLVTGVALIAQFATVALLIYLRRPGFGAPRQIIAVPVE
jgi:hypothetical protein